MFYCILRNSKEKVFPPAVLRAEVMTGLYEGIKKYAESDWIPVFIAEGTEIKVDYFMEQMKILEEANRELEIGDTLG